MWHSKKGLAQPQGPRTFFECAALNDGLILLRGHMLKIALTEQWGAVVERASVCRPQSTKLFKNSVVLRVKAIFCFLRSYYTCLALHPVGRLRH